MSNIPKIVRIAISAAARDITSCMKEAGAKMSNGSPEKISETIEKFVLGMVSGAYSKNKIDWVDASMDDEWLSRSAETIDPTAVKEKLQQYVNSPEMSKDKLVQDLGADKSWPQQKLNEIVRDPEKFKKENPDLASIVQGPGVVSDEIPEKLEPVTEEEPEIPAPAAGGAAPQDEFLDIFDLATQQDKGTETETHRPEQRQVNKGTGGVSHPKDIPGLKDQFTSSPSEVSVADASNRRSI